MLTFRHWKLWIRKGDTEADEVFRRDILPHVDHVRNCQQAIEYKIMANRKQRWFGLVQWPGVGSMFGPAQARLYAKFSLVFAQNGRWNDAETLQLIVKKYTDSVLGLDHAVSRRITLALAITYYSQGRGDEAGDLQDTVLQACMASLGPNSGETLTTMDLFGQTRWQQGRYSEARMLQQHAVDGLIKLRGPMHEDTLSAMGNLGKTVAKFLDDESLEEAGRLLKSAFDGMSEVLGPTHLKTLAVKEDLAALALQLEEQLPLAEKMEQEVLDCRKVKLGKENPYTLLTMALLARIKTAMGQHDDAEALICSALEIADRNLAEAHIGTLMGRTVLGIILINPRRLKEAEIVLSIVIEKQRNLSQHGGEFHPDRLGAMIELARCYRLQKKFDESIRLCDETIEGLRTISLKQHPLERKMQVQKVELLELKREAEERNNANQTGDVG